MNVKATKKMKGFMCHSGASTAVCMSLTQEYRSVIIPLRPNGKAGDRLKLLNNVQLGEQRSIRSSKNDQDKKVQQATKTLAVSDQVFQVVVMRVSIHCQGCAGKVKKHLSKMEGVTSFSIDLENKRVTVAGHVSPSGVLESLSKVKRAELWPC